MQDTPTIEATQAELDELTQRQEQLQQETTEKVAALDAAREELLAGRATDSKSVIAAQSALDGIQGTLDLCRARIASKREILAKLQAAQERNAAIAEIAAVATHIESELQEFQAAAARILDTLSTEANRMQTILNDLSGPRLQLENLSRKIGGLPGDLTDANGQPLDLSRQQLLKTAGNSLLLLTDLPGYNAYSRALSLVLQLAALQPAPLQAQPPAPPEAMERLKAA